MLRKWASQSPNAASVLVCVAGYLTGGLLGVLTGYLVSGAFETGAVIAFGSAAGVLALVWARHSGLVPEPEELNKPITLFGSTPTKR
jgi:hypothetical protein